MPQASVFDVIRIEAHRCNALSRAAGVALLLGILPEAQFDATEAFLCDELSIDRLRSITEANWAGELDRLTAGLIASVGAPWGVARQVVNLGLVECTRRQVVHAFCELDKVERLLEAPLDSQLMAFIRRECERVSAVERTDLAPVALSKLTPEGNAAFQQAAQAVVDAVNAGIHWPHLKITRADLDQYLPKEDV